MDKLVCSSLISNSVDMVGTASGTWLTNFFIVLKMDDHSARVSYEMITEKLHKPAYAVITRNGQELGKDIGSFIHKFLESQRDHA